MAKNETALRRILDQLDTGLDEMAEDMVRGFIAEVPGYDRLPPETLRQVRGITRANLQSFMAAVRDRRGPSAEELEVARESATRRAREGVSLAALLAAYRKGGEVGWKRVLQIVAGDGTLRAAGLEMASSIMRFTDEISGAVAQAYLEEYERLSADREAARRDFLDAALAGDLTSDEIAARAEALGLDPSGSFAVALLAPSGTPGDGDGVRQIQRRLKKVATELPHAERSLAVVRGTQVVVVSPGDEDHLAQALRSFVERAGMPLLAGVGRAHESLAELAASFREASMALASARSGTPSPVVVYGDLMVEELLLRERGVARRLARSVLDPLEQHPELRATLEQFLSSGPSLPAVAAKLYVHPNTVAYRLSRVRELTGRDPRTPAGVCELYLAVRASQLMEGDEG